MKKLLILVFVIALTSCVSPRLNRVCIIERPGISYNYNWHDFYNNHHKHFESNHHKNVKRHR